MQENSYKASLNKENIKELNMKNKKIIIHFTLAVSLLVCVCLTAKTKPTITNTSNYLSNKNENQSIAIINDLNSNEDVKVDQDNPEPDINKSNNTIANIRFNFNVKDPEQVKNVQQILGLKQDGIFGPKTDSAYQVAISEDNIRKVLSNKNKAANNSGLNNKIAKKEESSLSEESTMLE